ncbi:hypothetical protein NDU88_008061 [Pleurodeles waltl]|uniref:Uncharacterized protein n=1 Tax=Pleurodeles waltl TaxID=8319 RepID=A0AAV7U1H0_PLEWA|nr:hypothetical protein NDU88_008061 [Pleurodeles waltl]
MVGFRRRLPLHPSQPQRRPLLLLHSSRVLNGLTATSEQPPPCGLQKETTPASIAAAAEAAASPTQQPGPERPRCHLRTSPSLVGFRRRLPPHPSQPQRRPLLLLHSRQVLNGLAAIYEQLPPWWASEGDYPPQPSQQQRRLLHLLHSSQVLNGLAATSEQLPPWWAIEGGYPRIHRSARGGRSFSYTAAKT